MKGKANWLLLLLVFFCLALFLVKARAELEDPTIGDEDNFILNKHQWFCSQYGLRTTKHSVPLINVNHIQEPICIEYSRVMAWR